MVCVVHADTRRKTLIREDNTLEKMIWNLLDICLSISSGANCPGKALK